MRRMEETSAVADEGRSAWRQPRAAAAAAGDWLGEWRRIALLRRSGLDCGGLVECELESRSER